MRPDGRPSGPGRPEKARVFFALWPGDRVREGLHRAAVDSARRFRGRAMRRETLHLTLAFIGDVPVEDLSRLREAAAGVDCGAFSMTLDRLGFWGHNRILWAGTQGAVAGLSELAHALAERLEAAGYSSGIRTGRPFVPHVTLVRNVAERPTELPTLAPLEWACEQFALVRSRLSSAGSAYETIGHWPLRSG